MAGKFFQDHGVKLLCGIILVVLTVGGDHLLDEQKALREDLTEQLTGVKHELGNRVAAIEIWRAATEADRYTIHDAAQDRKEYQRIHGEILGVMRKDFKALTASIHEMALAIARIEAGVSPPVGQRPMWPTMLKDHEKDGG